MSLWVDYRAYYGKAPLKVTFGGNFVIVNEDLQDKFDKFIKKVYFYISSAHKLVKAVELLQLCCRSPSTSFRTMHIT